MKKNRIIHFLPFLICFLFLMGCKKEVPKKEAPTVITNDQVTEIDSGGAKIAGEVSSDGGDAVKEKGICWSSTNAVPNLWDSKTTEGEGTGSFTSALTGLQPHTIYNVRAYATNSAGTGYGKTLSFTTLYELNDYLPLKPGARYRYNYNSSYRYIYESSEKKGVCTWTFLPQSAGAPQVYQVEESFTGDYVHITDLGYGAPKIDSIHYENQIATLNFKVQNDGKVVFTIQVPYWGNTGLTFDRFIRSDKQDTCQVWGTINRGYLRKNVGITNLYYFSCGNHCSGVQYTLIEGPY